MKGTRKKARFAVGSAEMKWDENPIAAVIFVSFSLYIFRRVLWNPPCD